MSPLKTAWPLGTQSLAVRSCKLLTWLRRYPKARLVLRRSDLNQRHRACWGVAFALLLALRLLTPTGFMPAWGGDRFAIKLCDDAGAPVAVSSHHQHHGDADKAKHRQSCPYAAASAAPFFTLPPAAIAHPLAPTPLPAPRAIAAAFSLQKRVERPPSRAPPVPV
nr:DUF2946 family protein [Sphingomonas telluris]